jgi:hypothetical protein
MRNNTAVRDGGGLHQDPDSTVVLTRVTIDSNSSADNGGGAYLHGTAVLTIADSTVSNNTGGVEGGPADGYGAGIAVVDGATLSMINSTVSGNTSDASGAGIAALGRAPSTVLLNHVTVAFNVAADDGGGLFQDVGNFTASNTIVSSNTASSGLDCAGSFLSTGGNLIGDAAGCFGFDSGDDLLGGVAGLDPILTLNAPGTTATHALVGGSEAIDAGNSIACELEDQRGVLRDAACDIGAYEWLEPSIALTKTASLNDPDGNGFPEAGETIAYTFTITNDGKTLLTGVTLSDPALGINEPAPDLAIGETTTAGAVYTLSQADIDSGHIDNTATVSGIGTTGESVDASAFVSTELPSNPMITLSKVGTIHDTNGSTFTDIGDEIRYVFEATNVGNVTLSNVTVNDPKVTINDPGAGSLAPGASATWAAAHTLDQTDFDAGTYNNTATVTAFCPTGSTVCASDEASESTTVPQTKSISLTKSGTFNDESGDGFAQFDETITYAFTVTNDGNVTLTNVTIDDPTVSMAGGPIVGLAPGISDPTTFTGTYSITQADIDAGFVANTATASGTDPQGGTGWSHNRLGRSFDCLAIRDRAKRRTHGRRR